VGRFAVGVALGFDGLPWDVGVIQVAEGGFETFNLW
jgi:hypothetical protein